MFPLQKPDYSRDVTEESQKAFVFVHLVSSLGTNTESRLLTELWRELARKFGDVKFCEMRADLCIEGYPERNTPTILVYHKGDIVKQIVTLKELGGQATTLIGTSNKTWRLSQSLGLLMYQELTFADLQQLLTKVGAVQENDHRVLLPKQQDIPLNGKLRQGQLNNQDSDDEWD